MPEISAANRSKRKKASAVRPNQAPSKGGCSAKDEVGAVDRTFDGEVGLTADLTEGFAAWGVCFDLDGVFSSDLLAGADLPLSLLAVFAVSGVNLLAATGVALGATACAKFTRVAGFFAGPAAGFDSGLAFRLESEGVFDCAAGLGALFAAGLAGALLAVRADGLAAGFFAGEEGSEGFFWAICSIIA